MDGFPEALYTSSQSGWTDRDFLLSFLQEMATLIITKRIQNVKQGVSSVIPRGFEHYHPAEIDFEESRIQEIVNSMICVK